MPCYRICEFNKNSYDNGMRALRKWWEEWDLRILILYILIAQLYLHFFGRLCRKNKSLLIVILSIWLLYLFSDLLATIALGKLSKIKVDNNSNETMGEESLRVMWEPLFYLGGPDGHYRLTCRGKSIVDETPYRTLNPRPKNSLCPDSNLE